MWWILWAGVGFGLALMPAVLMWRNLGAYTPPPTLETGASAASGPASLGSSGVSVSQPPGGSSSTSAAAAGPERRSDPEADSEIDPDPVSEAQARRSAAAPPAISLLIPARNEGGTVGSALRHGLQSRGVDLELLVLDDGSTDETASIVREFAARDPRVRLLHGRPLQAGWCGKQFACRQLAAEARPESEYLAFIDADVELAPDALGRMIAFLHKQQASLVSGFPHQRTGTWLEKLLIPLIHVVLLGYLPIDAMRRTTAPAFGAGCGQLFLARRSDYERIDGHGAIRESLHDGITLPRAFRRAGMKTDLCDATELASCRMYRDARSVWRGLSKNATEGMAAPRAIVPWTVLLLGGHVMPPVMVACLPRLADGFQTSDPVLVSSWGLAWLGTLAVYMSRMVAAKTFRQSIFGAVLHPVGVALLVAIQWCALVRQQLGAPADWKGRAYPAQPSGPG